MRDKAIPRGKGLFHMRDKAIPPGKGLFHMQNNAILIGERLFQIIKYLVKKETKVYNYQIQMQSIY